MQLRARPSVAVVVLGAALAVASAASAGAGDPRRAITKADEASAKSVVLKAADLGAAFTARPTGSGDLPPGVRCGPLSESDLTVTGDAESPDFQLDQPGALLTVGSTAQVYRSVREANASWSRSQKPAALTCLSDIVERSGGAGQRIDVVSAKRLAFPKVAPRTAAYRIVARVRSGTASVKVYFDAVLLQQGRIQAGVVFTSAVQPVGSGDQAALARLVAGRIAKAQKKPAGAGLVA
jgi:hypothetical protein